MGHPHRDACCVVAAAGADVQPSYARSRSVMPSGMRPSIHRASPRPSWASGCSAVSSADSNAVRAASQSARSRACPGTYAVARLRNTVTVASITGGAPVTRLDGEGRSRQRLVPTATRYSFSNLPWSGVPRFHLSQNWSSAASNSASLPSLVAFARVAIVGP